MSSLVYYTCMHRWTQRKQIKRVNPKRVYPSGTEDEILQGICDITPWSSLGLEVGHWAFSNSKIRPFSKRSKPPRSFDQIFERLVRLMVYSGKQKTSVELNKVQTKKARVITITKGHWARSNCTKCTLHFIWSFKLITTFLPNKLYSD